MRLIKLLLHFVFQKKKNKGITMITDFIDSVVIIDDKEKEIEELAKKIARRGYFRKNSNSKSSR